MGLSRAQMQRVQGPDSIVSRTISERCSVISLDPGARSCSVMTASGSLLTGLAWPGSAYEARVPRVGQSFLVEWARGSRGVLTELPPELSTPPSARPKVSHLQESQGLLDSGERGRSYSTVLPSDLQPGDRLWLGEDGEHVGILSGGVVSLKASEFASLSLSRHNASARLTANELRVLTGAGSLVFRSDEEGRSGMSLDLGGDARFEADPSRENFRYRQRIFQDGYAVRTALTLPQGQEQWVHEVDDSGAVYEEADRYETSVRTDLRMDVGGAASLTAQELQMLLYGSADVEVGGRTSVRALGGLELISPAGSIDLSTGGSLSLGASRGATIALSGGMIPAPSNVALGLTAVNGSVVFDIGDPRRGDLAASKSSFRVNTVLGDVTLATKAGNVRVDSFLPGSVKLGGPGMGIASVVMYEALMTWMTAFGTLLDTHVHNAAGVPTTPPVVPIWATSAAGFSACRSIYVKVGG